MKSSVRTRSLLTAIGFLIALTSPALGSVDWGKLNSNFNGATFVKDESACVSCHEDALTHYNETKHAWASMKVPPRAQNPDCESCHGPRSIHVEEPDRRFELTEEAQAVACMDCHKGSQKMMNWQMGTHGASGVNCTSCHTVMEPKSDKALLSRKTETDLCASCHTDVTSQLQKASHHPVREGRLNCSDCHEVHGTPSKALLVKNTVNETCNSCHQDKRGPFLWEHAPAQENCASCHESHGSNNKDLLRVKGAAQCVTCHQYGGHVNEFRYNRTSNPYGNACVNCHVTVHGSNRPSGARFTR